MTEQDVFSETRMPPDGNIKVRRWKVTVEVNNFGTDGKVLSQKKTGEIMKALRVTVQKL